MFAARRLATNVPRVRAQASLFHSTAPAFVQKGDAIPDLDCLVENSPGNKINLAKEIKNKGVIIGTPAAFSASS
jgi:2-Cys peroxiredoxin 5